MKRNKKIKKNKLLVSLVLALVPLVLSADSIKVMFNDPLSNDRPLDECKSEICLELLKGINEAKDSIDFAIYGIRGQSKILESLKRAKDRGVLVRGIVDMNLSKMNYYRDTDRLVRELGNVRNDYEVDVRSKSREKKLVPKYCKAPKGFEGFIQCVGHSLDKDRCIVSSQASREAFEFSGDIMHHKFFVIDRKFVWTGSANISDSGIGGYNANTVIVIENERVALKYLEEFEEMFIKGRFHKEKKNKGVLKDVRIGDSLVTIGFSPQDRIVKNVVKDLILGAKKSIDVNVFFFTSKELAMYLVMAMRNGVKVRLIIDATAGKNGYSKHEILRGSGIDVKVENWGSKLHNKTAVIDNEILIGGSMNWTSAGDWSNDENVVVIRDRKIAKKASKYFEYLWNSIDDKWLKDNPNPESKDSGSSCYDGVDNDFDGLVDMEDDGCRGTERMKSLPKYWIVKKKSGNGLIKGNIGKRGKKIYHTPRSKYYGKTKIDESKGERWFCSDYEARFFGWRSSFK